MNTNFEYFYGSNDINSSNIKDEDVLICLDTNVLLNIYRYSDETRELLLESISSLKDKIFIPYNVAYEFSYNKKKILEEVITQKSKMKKEINGQVDIFKKVIEKVIDKTKKMKCDSSKKIIKDIKSSFSDKFDTFLEDWSTNNLNNLFDSYENLNTNDSISDLLATTLNKKVGSPYNQEDLDTISKEGEIRYDLGMPPGYADDTSAKDEIAYYYILDKTNDKFTSSIKFNKKYGDLIIWYQIIDKAKESKKFNKVLFVTDDSKEDWIFKISGRTIGMRAELRNEFHAKTEKYIKIINTNSFLQHFNNNQKDYIVYEEIHNKNNVHNIKFDNMKKIVYKRNLNEYLYKDNLYNIKNLEFDIMYFEDLIMNFRNVINNTEFILNKNDEIEDLISIIKKETSTIKSKLLKFDSYVDSLAKNTKLYRNYLYQLSKINIKFTNALLEYNNIKRSHDIFIDNTFD